MSTANVISLFWWGTLFLFNRSTEKLEESHRTEDNSLKSKTKNRLLCFSTPKYNLVSKVAAKPRMRVVVKHPHGHAGTVMHSVRFFGHQTVCGSEGKAH